MQNQEIGDIKGGDLESVLRSSLTEWFVTYFSDVRALHSYGNRVASRGDSLFGVADCGLIDYVNHVAGMTSHAVTSKLALKVMEGVVVPVADDSCVPLLEHHVREALLGNPVRVEAGRKRGPVCPVCCWHPSVGRTCRACRERGCDVVLEVVNVDIPFYLTPQFSESVKVLGYGNVVLGVDGIHRWWVTMPMAIFVLVSGATPLGSVPSSMSEYRAGMLEMAVSLAAAERTIVFRSHVTDVMKLMVASEGVILGPTLFYATLVHQAGMDGIQELTPGSLGYVGTRSVMKFTTSAVGVKLAALMRASSDDLVAGNMVTKAMMPSRYGLFLPIGLFLQTEFRAFRKGLWNLGYEFDADCLIERVLAVESAPAVIQTFSQRAALLNTSSGVHGFFPSTELSPVLRSPQGDVLQNLAGSDLSVETASSVSTVSVLESGSPVTWRPPMAETVTDDGDVVNYEGYGLEDTQESVVRLVETFDETDKFDDISKGIEFVPENLRDVAAGARHRSGLAKDMMTFMQSHEADHLTFDQKSAANLFYNSIFSELDDAQGLLDKGYFVDIILSSCYKDKPAVLVVEARVPHVKQPSFGLPVMRKVYALPRHVVDLFRGSGSVDEFSCADGWLIFNSAPLFGFDRAGRKVKQVDFMQLLANAKLRQDLQLPGLVETRLRELMDKGDDGLAVAVFRWWLFYNKCEVWNVAHTAIPKKGFRPYDSISVYEVDSCGYQFDLKYFGGVVTTKYSNVIFESKSPSAVVVAVYGFDLAVKAGNYSADFIKSLDGSKVKCYEADW